MTAKSKIEMTAVMMSDSHAAKTAFFECAGADGIPVQVYLDRKGVGGHDGSCTEYLATVQQHWPHTPGFSDHPDAESGRHTRDIRAYVKRIMDQARQGLEAGSYASHFSYVVMEADGTSSLLPKPAVAAFEQAWPEDLAESLPAAIAMIAE